MTATQSKIQRSKAAAPAAAGGLSSVPIQRSGGGAALSDYLFSHYRVSDPSDQSEVQAERAADKIMSGGQVHASEAAPGGAEIARSPEGDATPAGGGTGGSTGLPGPVQERMKGAFGRSFEGVRVHHDQRADSLSRGFHADAFTQGSDIYFRKGSYDPASRQGQHLIAHELAHVDQGGAGEIQRDVTDKDRLEAQMMDDPVFQDFFNAIKNNTALVGKIMENMLTAEEQTAAANAASGASGVGGAAARIGYGKGAADRTAGFFELAGGLATETGTAYGATTTALGLTGEKYKSNAKAITAAGQGASFIADAIQFGAGMVGGAAAGRKLNPYQTRKENAEKNIDSAKNNLGGLNRDQRVAITAELNAIKNDLVSSKISDARDKIIEFIKDHPENDYKACTDDVKSAQRELAGCPEDIKSVTAGLKNQKDERYASGLKAMGMGLGHGLSGIGAALQSAGFIGKSDNDNGARNNKFLIIGGVLSAVGGIVSSITGALSSATKAKRAVAQKAHNEQSKKSIMQALSELNNQIKGKSADAFDAQNEANQANRNSVYTAYQGLRSGGVDMSAFATAYKDKKAEDAAKILVGAYEGG